MNRLRPSLVLAGITLAATACSDSLSIGRPLVSRNAISAAFATVPLEFSNVTSSYAGDTDGLSSMFMPGPRMGGFSGGLMGGGMGDAFNGSMSAGRGFGHNGPFGGRFGGGFTCTGSFNAGTGRFVCNPITKNGVTVNQSMAYANSAGAVQQAFDTLTTNTVNVRSTATGTVSFVRDSTKRGNGPRHIGHFAGDTSTILTANSTVNHSSDRTVSGLAAGSTSRRINATSAGTEATTGTSSRGTFSASRAASDTTKDLVVPISNGKPTYPTSGIVTRNMKVTVGYAGAAAVTSTRREVITYDGSATAKVVITRDGVTQNCTMPLPRGPLTCS